MDEALREEIEAAAAEHFGDGAALNGMAALTGGASRDLWEFTVNADGEKHRLVLRRDPPGLEDPAGRDREWAVLRAAHSHGVAVPEPLFRTAGGGIALRWVDGEGRAKHILGDEAFAGARPDLLGALAQQAAKIHAIPVADVDLPEPEFPPPEQALIGLEDQLDQLSEPHPALELGLRWLWSNVPDNRDAAVVHGDFRLGNVLVGADGLAAVLDWELAHLGDPAEDLGWLCLRSWRFGHADRPAGGLGTRDELLAAYAAAGGREVTRDELRFWEAYGNVRWGVICVAQAQAGRAQRQLERAMIGRRTCEAEWDLLAMIGAS